MNTVDQTNRGFVHHRSLMWFCTLNLFIAACGPRQVRQTSAASAPIAWTANIFEDHPLVGTIWSSKERKSIAFEDVMKRLLSAPVILIGERHDNPDHHVIQAKILSSLLPGALVGFEMLDHGDAPALAKATSPTSVRELTKWDDSGWPAFDIYAPVFKAIFASAHRPAAVHPERADIRASMMGPSSQAHRTGTYDGVLGPEGIAALKKDIDRSHCGYAPTSLINAMMLAQEFKDRVMSRHLLAPSQIKQRVLIAGNGHVRRDYGVPNHMEKSTVSIGIIEVRPSKINPLDYGVGRYDYLWFTPRLDNLSPCAKYRKALEAMQRRHHHRTNKIEKSSGTL